MLPQIALWSSDWDTYQVNAYSKSFLISVCYDGFTCNNTECIYKEKLCDGVFDCSDRSDESNCGKKKHFSNGA